MAALTTPTIEDLIYGIRNMLNQPSPFNSTWTDEELAAYVNEAIRRFFVEVVQHGEGQFTEVADLNIEAGSDTIELPHDFFEMKQVLRKVDSGYAPLTYRNNIGEGYTNTDNSSGGAYLPSYHFRGNNLVLRPGPNFAEKGGIRIEYVQFPETLLTGGDSLTGHVAPVFRDLIETYAIYKAKLKESLTSGTNTYGPIRENLNDLFTAFKETIAQRSFAATSVKPFSPEDC